MANEKRWRKYDPAVRELYHVFAEISLNNDIESFQYVTKLIHRGALECLKTLGAVEDFLAKNDGLEV